MAFDRIALESAFTDIGTRALADHRLVEIAAEQALALVARYYPAQRISPRTQFGIEEIFGARL